MTEGRANHEILPPNYSISSSNCAYRLSIYCVTFHGRMESILPRTVTYIPPLVVLLGLLQSSRPYSRIRACILSVELHQALIDLTVESLDWTRPRKTGMIPSLSAVLPLPRIANMPQSGLSLMVHTDLVERWTGSGSEPGYVRISRADCMGNKLDDTGSSAKLVFEATRS